MAGTEDDYDNGDSDSPLKQGPKFTVLSLKERMEKASADQSPSNSQFKNLRDFWDGAPANGQNPQQPSSEMMALSPKSPRSKGQEPREASLPKSLAADKKLYLNPNYYPSLPAKDLEKPHFRAQRGENGNLKMYATDISPSKREPREKEQPCPAPLPRHESASSDEGKELGSSSIRPVAESKSVESQLWIMTQERQKPPHHPHPWRSSEQAQSMEGRAFTAQRDRETRFQGSRKTRLGNSTGRVNAFRRATSMYALNLAEGSPERPMETQEEPMGGRQPPSRETPERPSSGASDDGEQPTPLARSFMPRDYRHYLGLSEGAMFQCALAAEKEEETGACFPPESELELSVGADLSGPVPQGVWRRPRPGWGVRSSTPETWSYSGTSSACDDEDSHPVKKALKRADLKPVSSCKSVEDIMSLPTKEERRKNTTRRQLMLSMDDVSMVSSSPPSSISDHAQMKKMSKSVPSFLQKESSWRDSDSTSESSVHTGRQARTGGSLTNLSGSSGMASVSSVSGSVMSIYSGDFGNVEVRGTVQFSMTYVQKLKEFHIFVVQCRDLAVADAGKNRSNPYVKCYLLPEQAKLGKRKTSVKKKTLNPTFNEILRYRIRLETLKTQILNLSVWHNDTFGRNSFLGEVELDLSEWDFGNTQINNFTLQRRTQSGLQPSDYRGEMRLALRFMPQMSSSNRLSTTGEVHIWVKDCKDLPVIRGTSIDPFVKCFVLPDTSRKSRQKTRVMKRTESPAFNHTMVYDGFRMEDLPEACVELTVWDHDRLASHFVGGLRLGLGTGKSYGALVDWMDSNADEANLWERMMDSPNDWVEEALPLRTLTLAKNVWK
ncbi:hypothetical protein AAFF_G00237820 [Aldrovandia affinis]|uniref:Synaptotagmin-like protein 2 n=1 Tax=Aldrovandia affinis TaxID=143900 RepID=A0AAD7REL0_9TELE|nr:hypothetical protein AAFF_G00237820 [Aldrovandia affinis]